MAMGEKRLRASLLAAGLSALALGAAVAAPIPSLKPPAPESPYVSAGDEAILRAAFDALDDRKHGLAQALLDDVRAEDARLLGEWAYLRSKADVTSLPRLDAFLRAAPGWPREAAIQRKAEDLLTDETDPGLVLDFFADREPVSGNGKLQLGRALHTTGETARGEALIRSAWVDHDWPKADETDSLSRYGAFLRPEDHFAKADRQLFDIVATNTQRIVPLLTEERQAEARARIALLKRDRNAPALYRALPEASRRDPGVLHAAIRYHRRAGEDVEATRLAGLAPDERRDPEAWFGETRLLARTALNEGRFEDAYVLSAGTGLTEGADFAEAEFMAGWVALRFLGDPERAAAHFAHITSGVSSPISLSRGHYWLGRALAAAGDEAGAGAAYREAASHPYAYYGQLAAEALGEGVPAQAFPEAEQPSADDLTAFEARGMVAAMRILAELGRDQDFDRFARALDDELDSTGDVLAYADLVLGERKPHLAVRAGKIARGNAAFVPRVTYPDYPVPDAAKAYVEAPLILGLSRQESEFNPRAHSRAKAKGLMQMLSSTARITARKEGMPYAEARLFDDPTYNQTLGAAHLSHLLEREGGSYVRVLAGYNAGPHRVDRWTERYGDPRDGTVDPVDWVELIPFSETRNYVMRVLENVQIYRAREGGGPIAGGLTADILRGGAREEAIGQAVPSPVLAAEAGGDVLSVTTMRKPAALRAYEERLAAAAAAALVN